MTIIPRCNSLIALALVLGSSATQAVARPGDWGGPGWGNQRWSDRDAGGSSQEGRIGKVEVARFRAEGDAAAALGKGSVEVTGMLRAADGPSSPVFEAAVVDALARAGYDTMAPAGSGAQIAEVLVRREVVVPQEAPHKPVSGEMTMGVSNHGSMMGLGLAVDLSKPKKALVSTRLDARIKDRASGQVLWEGRASMITREGDQRWSDSAIAGKLATVLFDRFPGQTGETLVRH